MDKTFKTLIMIAFLILGGMGLSACHTVEGAGQDIESAGESIQDAAD